jgi:hypothetical protein
VGRTARLIVRKISVCTKDSHLILCMWVQIPDKLQCTPELNSQTCSVEKLRGIKGPRSGVYRGFALRGKPDGRGEWVSENARHTYAGNWRGGKRHGQGKETSFFLGRTYRGGFWDDVACGAGVIESFQGLGSEEMVTYVEGTKRYGFWPGGCANGPNVGYQGRVCLGLAYKKDPWSPTYKHH